MPHEPITQSHPLLSYIKNKSLIRPREPQSQQDLLDVTNPATSEFLGTVSCVNAAATAEAISVARLAQKKWHALGAYRRADHLHQWADLMTANKDDLAIIMTLEQGKPITEARGEIDYALSFLHWFAEEGKRQYGETIPSQKDGARMLTIRQPVGVTAAVTPWNFPSAMITRKAGAALAAGCSMLVRPASETPFSAIALEILAREAGIPTGVFTILVGDGPSIVGALTESETVRALSFTGSTHVGKLLTRQSADTMKKVSMELGGHAPFIVLEDAQLEAAVTGVMGAKFATSGQDCLAVNKCYVHTSLYEKFCAMAADAAANLRVGEGLDEATEIGPLMSEGAIKKCESHICDAISKGATLLTGGKRKIAGKLFMEPTVLMDVTPEMLISSEETFGPVLPISKFTDQEAMTQHANDTPYGLAAYVYGSDMTTLWDIGEKLDYGMISINTPSMTGPSIPFGGFKQSGLGREGGRHGLDDYTEIKYMCLGNMPSHL